MPSVRSFFLTFLTLITCAYSPVISQQGISAFSCEFSRVTGVQSYVDSVGGRFYYDGQRAIFRIHDPVDQWLLIEKNIVTIYYPKSNRCFILESKNAVVLPLVTALIAATLPDYGLGALSFEIKDQEMNGDTLITFWSSSKFFSNLGQFKIAHVGERLVYSQYEDDNLHVKTKTTFDRYEKTAGIYFPTYMATELWLAEKFSFEKLSIRSMSVNQQLPSEVLFFQVPPNAIIEKKDW